MKKFLLMMAFLGGQTLAAKPFPSECEAFLTTLEAASNLIAEAESAKLKEITDLLQHFSHMREDWQKIQNTDDLLKRERSEKLFVNFCIDYSQALEELLEKVQR